VAMALILMFPSPIIPFDIVTIIDHHEGSNLLLHAHLSLPAAPNPIDDTRRVVVVQAFVVGGDHHQQHHRGSNNDILSRFDFQCKILMTVGRTPNTEMREFSKR